MQREIKFRGWYEKDKGMIYQDKLNVEHQMILFWNCVATLPDIIVMQFTGLKDKNGKEIYEGDLVKGVNGLNGGPSEVFYAHGVWQPFDYLACRDETKFEIIGNIYENPELIK